MRRLASQCPVQNNLHLYWPTALLFDKMSQHLLHSQYQPNACSCLSVIAYSCLSFRSPPRTFDSHI